MKVVWRVILFVFRIFDKLVNLPIRYDPKSGHFFAPTKFTQMIGWYIGSFCAFGFITIIVYRIMCQVFSPERNEFLGFDLECVVQYSIGFIICLEAAACIWTCQYKLKTLVILLNAALNISRRQEKYYAGDKISILGINIDTGSLIAIIASIGFLAFPALTFAVPFLRQADPSSHLAMILFPEANPLTQHTLAGIYQGSVTAFGAIVCLQLLLSITAFIVELCGLMARASTVTNPWVSMQLKKLYMKIRKPPSIRGEGARISMGKGFPGYVAITFVAPVIQQGRCFLEYHQHVKSPIADSLEKNRRRNHVIMKWKVAVSKVTCFRRNLMLHREITILNSVLYEAFIIYTPTLLAVGMSLVVICTFFPMRFDLPVVVSLPCWLVAVTVTAIIIFLSPAAAIVARISDRFHLFWGQRLRTSLNRKQLRSCKPVAIWIGPFGYFHHKTLLYIFHIVFNYLGTLLINFK